MPYSFYPDLFILLASVAVFSGPVAAEVRRLSPRIVTTRYGSVRGLLMPVANRHLQPVEVFLGVPYASAPVGALRFMPPVTPPPWTGVRLADHLSPVCPQKLPDISNETEALTRMPPGRLKHLKRLMPYLKNQSEDCLYLNIYLPASVAVERSGQKLAVLLFIHGESYEWSSGNSYDGSVLASYSNMVVITLNYRLGILGFLPALHGASRGNFGLMDQVAALHWIQENILGFGGDPRSVTVLGQGHGAACVNLLMVSPMAKGYFHRAIIHSGSALSPWAIAGEAIYYTHKLARALNCPLHDNKTMMGCMRQRPLADIMRVQFKVPKYLTAFGPSIDGVVVPDAPEVLMKANDSLYAKYDLLFGVTRVEGYSEFSLEEERNGIDTDRRDRLVRTLVRNLFLYHLQEIYLTVINEYTDWTQPILNPQNVFESVLNAIGDALTVAPVVRSGLHHSKFGMNTFFFVFFHQTESGDYPSKWGCVNGEDMPYVFGAPLVSALGHFNNRNYTLLEKTLSEMVMTYWSSFAKIGNLTIAPLDMDTDRMNRGRFERFSWLPYEHVHQRYLQLGLKVKVKDHYHAHRLSYWIHLIPKLHQPGNSTSTPEHHQLEDHDNMDSYDGLVRQGLTSLDVSTTPSLPHDAGPETHTEKILDNASEDGLGNPRSTGTELQVVSTVSPEKANHSESMVVVVHQSGYSTALSITVAIGCSLLVLNILIFAGVCYQRDKHRTETKRNSIKYQVGIPHDEKSGHSTGKRKQPLAHVAPSTVGVGDPQEFLLSPSYTHCHSDYSPPMIPPRPMAVPPVTITVSDTAISEACEMKLRSEMDSGAESLRV